MNQKNLEKLAAELKELGFDKKLATELEKQMKKSPAEIQLETKMLVGRTSADYILHFRQSSSSDYYFLNKYDAILDRGKPIGGNEKYMVFSQDEAGKKLIKNFDNPHLAIDYFQAQKGKAELAVGETPQVKYPLASKENDKVTFVEKEFRSVFYVPSVRQTMYVESGKGFTASQAANLLDGRAVYRDDLLNIAGQPYKAWIALDFEKEKDRFQNYKTRQYNDPAYGFNLRETLEKYQIQELKDPQKLKVLEDSLKNGNRASVTVDAEGKNVKMMIEAAPRYSQLKFYNEAGRSEKREAYLKEPLSTPIEKSTQKAQTNSVKK